MNWIVHTIALFLLTFNSLFAEVIEIAHLDEVWRHLTPNTLIIYDIDNTLIEMNQMLGSDQWFYYRFNQKMAMGQPASEAIEEVLNEWEAVQHLSGCHAVEPSAPQIVASTQKEFKVIGLTARGLALANRTVQLLKSAGFDLSLNTITGEEHHFIVDKEGVLFRKGILFTAGRHKGRSLKALIEGCGFCPEKILFIDDKEAQLRFVEGFCQDEGIPFIGLRYGFTDKTVAAFDPSIAEIQWNHFARILSDEEAETIAKGSKK